MKHTSLVLVGVCLAVILTSTPSLGQPVAQPTIHRVTLQADTGVLTITGTGLSQDLQVTVDGQPVPQLPGATSVEMQVLAPVTVVTTPGTYRLTVTDPMRHVGDAFVVAGGAASDAPALARVAVGDARPNEAPGPATTSAESASIGGPNHSGQSALTRQPHAVIENSGFPFLTAVGFQALAANTTGSSNTAVGFQALTANASGNANTSTGDSALAANTSGNLNTAAGYGALRSNTTGNDNAAFGAATLAANSTGGQNTAAGTTALFSNTTGSRNTAHGHSSLLNNIGGSDNAAVGYYALSSNLGGSFNTATGASALFSNTTGSQNTASGYQALQSNTTGIANTAAGVGALFANVVGARNTASGYAALASNLYGDDNVAVGYEALAQSPGGRWNVSLGTGSLRWAESDSNAAVGYRALGLLSGGGGANTALGHQAGAQLDQGTSNIYVGANVSGVGVEHFTTRIGLTQSRAFMAGVWGTTLTGTAAQVFIDANGQLGTGTPVAMLSATSTLVTPAAWQEQVVAQEAVNAALRARIDQLEARLEALVVAGRRR